jgi:magnesium transporter
MQETIKLFENLIEEKKWMTIRHLIDDMNFVDLAEIIDEFSEPEDIILFRLLPRELAKDTFQELPLYKQELIIERLASNVNKLSNLLNDLDPDDRTAILEELPGMVAQRLIQLLAPEERKIATTLLGYPEDSIGRLMTPEFIAIKSHMTVAQALEHIRKYGQDSETLNVIYVVDNQWKLLDDIRIRELILASPEEKVEDLMDGKFVTLSAFDDEEEAIRVFQDHDKVALPVVDKEGTLIGIVTFDDIMDLVEEETTEDFHRFGAMQDAVEDPLNATIGFLYKRRIMWLFALVFMNVFSGAAIAQFDNIIQKVVSLIYFLPLLIGSGGNAGAQSATLMIRSLATGDVEMKDWFYLIGKEFLVSLLLGLTMAVGVGLIASYRAPQIILVVTSTMVLTVMTGSLIGLSLPFVFTKFKLDPATASAPLITSISDILGVVIYFSIATWVFGF